MDSLRVSVGADRLFLAWGALTGSTGHGVAELLRIGLPSSSVSAGKEAQAAIDASHSEAEAEQKRAEVEAEAEAAETAAAQEAAAAYEVQNRRQDSEVRADACSARII